MNNQYNLYPNPYHTNPTTPSIYPNPYDTVQTPSSMEFPGEMNTNFQSTQSNGFFGQYAVQQAPYTALTQPMATNATAAYPAIAFQPMGAPMMTNQPQVAPMYNAYQSAVPPMGFSIYDTQPIQQFQTPVNPYSYPSFSYPQPAAPIYVEQTPENNPFLTPSAPPMDMEIAQSEPEVDANLLKLEQELSDAQAALHCTQLEIDGIAEKIAQTEATAQTLKNKARLNKEDNYIENISKLYFDKEEAVRKFTEILEIVKKREETLNLYKNK